MNVMCARQEWIKEDKETRRSPTGQPRRTTKDQDIRFSKLALRDRFTRFIGDQRLTEEGSDSMRT